MFEASFLFFIYEDFIFRSCNCGKPVYNLFNEIKKKVQTFALYDSESKHER